MGKRSKKQRRRKNSPKTTSSQATRRSNQCAQSKRVRKLWLQIGGALFTILTAVLMPLYFQYQSDNANLELKNLASTTLAKQNTLEAILKTTSGSTQCLGNFVRVYTESNQVCFSNVGTMDWNTANVVKIETGSFQVSWTYLSPNGLRHHSPTRANESISWCPGQMRIYEIPIHVLQVNLSPPTGECVAT